ncbi:MAG: hypothetical protein ABGX07_01580 [Pirellulaceae bacterium]|jgi:uncharacterized membrane protein YedE/YeeE|nr:hypothetical protein [Planctomycetaceae bacterium]HIM31435.1 hypothetical protein [Planctomycetota bacterium]
MKHRRNRAVPFLIVIFSMIAGMFSANALDRWNLERGHSTDAMELNAEFGSEIWVAHTDTSLTLDATP